MLGGGNTKTHIYADTHTLIYAREHARTQGEHQAGLLVCDFPITRSRACSCRSCCCKISNCLCSSSNCRLMYSWRGSSREWGRTERGKERERTSNCIGNRSFQVKCRRREGEAYPAPHRTGRGGHSKASLQCSQKHSPRASSS